MQRGATADAPVAGRAHRPGWMPKLGLITAAALLAAPAGADAAVTCDLSSGLLDISIGASGDVPARPCPKGAGSSWAPLAGPA
jgi:hypothetical protein